MKKINIFSLILILLLSCQSKKEIAIKKSDVVVYKFLYNNDYPYPQTEESFWSNGIEQSEFAIYNYKGLKVEQFIEFLHYQKKAPLENDPNSNFWYMYAFVFTNNDTIYANGRLDEWKIKSNGKVAYYSGPYTNTPEEKKELCNLFSFNNFFSKTVPTKYPITE